MKEPKFILGARYILQTETTFGSASHLTLPKGSALVFRRKISSRYDDCDVYVFHDSSRNTELEFWPAVGVAHDEIRSRFVPDPDWLNTEALSEARAMTLWGKPRNAVSAFLAERQVNNVDQHVDQLFQERISIIKSVGLRKIVQGSLLILAPIAGYVLSTTVGVLPLRLFSMLVLAGIIGIFILLKGTELFLSPSKSTIDLSSD